MQLTIDIPDDEIRVLASGMVKPADWWEAKANEHAGSSTAAVYRLNAAIHRAAEQLGPEREPVTKGTPTGTLVARHLRYLDSTVTAWFVGPDPKAPDEGFYPHWTDADKVTDEVEPYDGWYVVKGEQG